MRILHLWIIPAFFAACAMLGANTAHADEEAAWTALRNGAVAIVRHAIAPGTGDPANFTLEDCATQRNLSQAGREQSVALGARIRAEGVRVGTVLHSRWCRAHETAELAFPGNAQPEPALDSFFRDRSTRDAQTDAIREIVKSWQGPGALIMVTHQVNISALTGQFTRQGEVIVMRARDNAIEVVGTIKP